MRFSRTSSSTPREESHDARALVQWDHGVTCGEHGLPNLGYSAEGREVLDKAKSLAHISWYQMSQPSEQELKSLYDLALRIAYV